MKFDFIIVGSGLAGMNAALNASNYGKVLLLSKKKITQSNTYYAQGGIAVALDPQDNFSSHLQDTLAAGSFHNHKNHTRFMVKNGPAAINKLVSMGMKFSTNSGQIALTREGGHSHRRVAFYKDHTGKRVVQTLKQNVLQKKSIKVVENALATDLIIKDSVCLGINVIIDGNYTSFFSKLVVLATGGLGMLFSKTTNPSVSTGDGLAMAIKAQAKYQDLEFIQFHPTVLNLSRDAAEQFQTKFLLSEALRGEGAYILDRKGKRFLKEIHPLAELAPRDIVARAVYEEGEAYLDISHIDSQKIKGHFSNIFQKLQKHNLDLSRDRIPISPAAHYSCGGIKINQKGETSIKNLLAYGEVAYTGVHGANRLASNSLLEAMVFSEQIKSVLESTSRKIRTIRTKHEKINASISTNTIRRKLRQLNWQYMGLVRRRQSLKKLIFEIDLLSQEIQRHSWSPKRIETENMLLVSRHLALSAYKRHRSLGTHFVV